MPPLVLMHHLIHCFMPCILYRRPWTQQTDSNLLFFQVFPPEQQQSGKLPQELYRLLDPQASVDLPSAHLVSSRQLDNRELDKLFAALGRNKITWRRALVLHEWLLSMGHTPDDRLCTTLIRVCSQHGQTMTALSLYDWMRSSQRAGGAGLVPTVYTYTAAMRAALTGNMIDRAVKVIDMSATTALLEQQHRTLPVFSSMLRVSWSAEHSECVS